MIIKDRMYYRFSAYGFLKNLRFFEPFIILIFRDSGLTFLQIGLLYSIRDLANNILEIPTGVFADTFGRRKAMVLAFIAYIASFIIFFSFSEFYIYALAMILFAFGEAFRSGTHKALILEYLKLKDMLDVKVAYYGRTRGASQMGSAFNSLIAAALLFYTGDYRTMFLATTIPYLIDLFNLATYPKILDGDPAGLARGTAWAGAKATLNDFVGIFKDRNAMRAIFNSSTFTALFKATKDYLQTVLEAVALALPFLIGLEDIKRSGVVVGVVYFFIYLLTSAASRGSDRFSRGFRNLASPINLTFLIGVGFLFVAGLATWQNLALISILVFLGFYVLQNLRKPMTVAFISDQISHRVMASGLSVETQFTTILVAIFAPILGALADAFGVGLALALLGAGTFLFYFFVRVREQTPTVETP
ncbi:MAG: MFS transporter [Anaerolineales bacterium]|nr:MFS transporter [Anaerolineales bacterium]